MAKPIPKSTRKENTEVSVNEEIRWPFGRLNYIMFGVALLVIIIGYVLLAQGSITMAPLLLVVGYCVLVPVAIMVKDKTVYTERPTTTDSPDTP